VIERNVWVAAGATNIGATNIGGVTVGENSVVAAGAVVGGNPARVIRSIGD
jgi:acetyltransferase-like isoleucine patch superfamily enzyme